MASERANRENKERRSRSRKRAPEAENEAESSGALHPQHAHVLQLQHTIGNRAVQRALTLEQKAENLKSPRYAGNPRLEQAFDNSPALRKGEKDTQGNAVALVQQGLIDDGFDMPISTQKTGAPDGIFGSETREVVKEFQRKHGLDDDGVVGRDTMRRLDELAGGAGPQPEDKPEIEATDKAMGERVAEKVNEINEFGERTPTSGVYYDFEYEAHHKADPVRYPLKFEQYEKGLTNSTYFEQLDGHWHWRLRPGVSASEGIKAWIKGLTIAECFTALIAIQYDTIRAAVGDKKFDEHFGSASKAVPKEQRLRIKPPPTDDLPISKFRTATEAAQKGDEGTPGNRPAQIGEWYYFYNHPQYLLKHPDGAFQGENAIYMGKNENDEQTWAGMGVPPVTEDGMYTAMADAYNGGRTPRDYQEILNRHRIMIPRGANTEQVYKDNIAKISEEYRLKSEGGIVQDSIQADDVVKAPEYTIDGITRKGGFLGMVGMKIDASEVEKLRKK